MNGPARTADTRQHILRVAEEHFARFGYAGTSVRGIIKDAGVNLAAVHYHFGSKDELYNAALEQYARPLVERQMAEVEAYLQTNQSPALNEIVRIFYEPAIAITAIDNQQGKVASALLARCFTEPPEIQYLANQQFDPCRQAFARALGLCLPQASAAQLLWHVEFMVGLMITYLMRREFVQSAQSGNQAAVVEQLTRFASAGIKAV